MPIFDLHCLSFEYNLLYRLKYFPVKFKCVNLLHQNHMIKKVEAKIRKLDQKVSNLAFLDHFLTTGSFLQLLFTEITARDYFFGLSLGQRHYRIK